MSKAKKSLCVVVDASVARAAGEKEWGVSSNCRKVLECVRSVCHRIALTPEIRDEWKRHRSTFFRRWLASMFAKKKVVRVDVSGLSGLDETDQSSLPWDVAKDLHLLDAAVHTDKVVVTRDTKLVRSLQVLPDDSPVREVADSIRWLNPETDLSDALRFLLCSGDD